MCKCDRMFTGFRWQNLTILSKRDFPSKAKGVYVIRISKRGEPIEQIIFRAYEFIGKINWSAFEKFVLNRIHRLEEIRDCPVIYIGAAPTSLQSRYDDLCGKRHTALYAVLALLFADWKLDFGWLEDDNPREKEKRLKQQYYSIHGKLPALVKR